MAPRLALLAAGRLPSQKGRPPTDSPIPRMALRVGVGATRAGRRLGLAADGRRAGRSAFASRQGAPPAAGALRGSQPRKGNPVGGRAESKFGAARRHPTRRGATGLPAGAGATRGSSQRCARRAPSKPSGAEGDKRLPGNLGAAALAQSLGTTGPRQRQRRVGVSVLSALATSACAHRSIGPRHERPRSPAGRAAEPCIGQLPCRPAPSGATVGSARLPLGGGANGCLKVNAYGVGPYLDRWPRRSLTSASVTA